LEIGYFPQSTNLMNILFVNHGGPNTNSMQHIRAFAAALHAQGHPCSILLQFIDTPTDQCGKSISCHTVEEMVNNGYPFPDKQPPDIIHAWTPREPVRQILAQLPPAPGAKLLIHLEDNEAEILKRSSLAEASHLCLPYAANQLKKQTDGFTYIIESLKEDVPPEKPARLLYPAVDLKLFNPETHSHSQLKRRFALPDGFKFLVYPGGATDANEQDLLTLFETLAILNREGVPTLLLKTGFPSPRLRNQLRPDVAAFIRDLGYLAREDLPSLMDLADVLIQPGNIDSFNEKRLPSKIPEFLAMGKAIIVPNCNIGRQLGPSQSARVLNNLSPAQLAKHCQDLWENAPNRTEMGLKARDFAEKHFDPEQQCRILESFYKELREAPIPTSPTTRSSLKLAANGFEQLSHALHDELIDVDAWVTQFRLLCQWSKPTASKPEKPPALPTMQLCQVYFSVNGTYSEDASTILPLFNGSAQLLQLHMQWTEDMQEIRIDPGRCPGFYCLESFQLEQPSGLALITPESGYDLIPCGTVNPTEAPNTLESIGNDPHWILRPKQSIPPGPLLLKMRISAHFEAAPKQHTHEPTSPKHHALTASREDLEKILSAFIRKLPWYKRFRTQRMLRKHLP